MRPGVPDVHITDSQDAEMASYRPLAVQAVLGLIFGLLSPLAMVDPMLWAIPVLGLFFSYWALRRIKKSSQAMIGWKIAIAGFMFSLLFLAAAPSDWLYYRWMVSQEARQFAALWFKYVVQDEPTKAHQLTAAPQTRQPLDNKLWAYYRGNVRQRRELENYVKSPAVRTLLALGARAQVRFYQTAGQARNNDNDQVEQIFAVTYEEGGERKSFFVLVRMLRMKLKSGGAEWRILGAEAGIRPEGWQDTAS